MNFIVEFYKGLDAINLIIFWGVIIVILLLLIFSIILANNNKKLKRLLYQKENDNHENDIPIIKEKIINNTIINNNYEPEEKEEEIIVKNDEPVEEENHFVAEEHVIEYNEEPKQIVKQNDNVETERKAYQRNVLRTMSSNQTSPIGITNNNVNRQEYKNAQELNEILNNKPEITNEKTTYLENVSKKLEEASNNTDIKRTDYELKQEEDAVISYEELMRRANNIKIEEEEDVVISIEELERRRKEKEKLYQITSEAEDDSFIKELKSFRNDL